MSRFARVRSAALRGVLAAAIVAVPVASAARERAPAAPAADRFAGLSAYVDGIMAQQIATSDVAGAVVTVVDHGRVVLSRGYGYADIASRTRVDPARTLFRPGSVSKLFTWVALMQQVERGRVDLDADVNTYLDFHIPDFKSAPIRVRDLLSHSPGMSDISGFIVGSSDKVVPYQAWIKAHIPQRLWAPGTEVSYSNYGAALAGYIVERVSGEPYPAYVEAHIFRPLGMTSTTFREPLPAVLAPRMATGYRKIEGRLDAKPFEWLSSVMPAGSSTSSAPDMARFMLALLGNGALGGARILRPESVALLERDSLANAPHLPGMAHGFLVERESGPRLVGHAGNTVDVHSDLVLAPTQGVGFFVSLTGGAASSPARTQLRDAIIGRLFPTAPASRWTGAETTPPLGLYRPNRRDYSKPANPAGDMTVGHPAPHVITTDGEAGKAAWAQVGPSLYEQITGARDGGPYDRLEFYGTADDPRVSLASQPYETYHLVKDR